MSKYTTITYDRRVPSARMQRIISDASPIPTPPTPPPPTPPVTVTGEVRLEGIPLDSTGVTLSSVGVFTTDLSGTYVGTVASGYSGNASLAGYGLPQYTVTPAARVYAGLLVNQAGQDFDIDINFLNLSGFILSSGTGVATQITNGTGTWTTAANGSYGYYVPYGWSGSTAPIFYGTGSFSPFSYTYGPVGVDHPDQNFNYTPPAQLWSIDGTITNEGIGIAIGINDGTNFWTSAVANGSYGLVALGGWSGTVRPTTYFSTPDAYVYTSLGTDYTAQDFDVPTPLLLAADSYMSWASWPLTLPDRWFVIAQNPVDLTLSVWGTTAGTLTAIETAPDFGTYYSVYGVNNASAQNTFRSNEQYSSPPLPPLVSLNGSVFDAVYGTGFSQNLYLDTVGTFNTDVAGSWGQGISVPYTGYLYPVDIPVNGTFQPPYRSYVALGTDEFNQDFVFGYPSVVLSGVTTWDAGTGFGAKLVIGSYGTIRTDTGNGSYSVSLPYNFTGTVLPLVEAVTGTYTPSSRGYVALTASQTGQNYDFVPTPPPPPAPTYLISGTVTPGFVTGIEFTGIGTIFTAASGSYGQQVVQGYSGTATPHATPDVFAPVQRFYGSVGANTPNQDYTYTLPFFAVVGEIRLDGVPTGGISVSFTGDGQGTSDGAGTYAGNLVYGYNGTASVLGYTGTGYIITPPVRVYTGLTGPLAGQDYAIASQFFTISGSLTDGASPMAGIGVELTAHGTVITDGTGVYSQLVSTGYSGTGIPHYSGGTFDPNLRVYTNVLSEQQQNYVFYGTGTVAPTDCPVVSTLAVIPIDATPKNPSRNVIDPVNNLLWVIDENYPNVYYLDVVAGTYAGSVSTAASGGSPCIAYDAVNQKVVVTTYDGSLAFINPVTKDVTFSNFVQQWPNFHMLAVDQYGTVYVCDNRNNVTGSLYVVDGATEQLLASYHLGMHGVSSDSICWAENINRLVLNSNGFGLTRFYLFDTTTGNFSASVLTNGSWTFSYENYYVKGTGNVLMSQDGATAVQIIDIAQGTDATVLGSLAADINDGSPTRAGDVTEDTCANTLFVSDGNYGVWEYTMNGSYTLLNVFDNGYLGLNPTGLAHSRATNQVYYENYIDGTTYSLPYAQYPISGWVYEAGTGIANAAVEFTTFGTQTADANGTYFLIVPVQWSGTVTPHLAAGTFVPLDRVYTNVAAAQTNQDFEYFWGGYLFLTLGTSGYFFPSLASDAVVVNGTIVQSNNDGYVYTSTQGRTDWTLRGFPSIGGRIAYSDNLQRYIVVGGGGAIWEAEDLSVWYSRTSGVAPNALTSVAAGGDRFVAVGVDGNASMSTDGTNWTATFAGSQQLTDVYYDGAQFVATGVANIVYTTVNGTAWTLRATSPQNTWKAGVYSPELGLHVIVGINGASTSGAVATSTDGTNWTEIPGAIPTTTDLTGIAWGSNRFVATDYNGVIWTSTNGTAWDYATKDPYGKVARRVDYWKNDWFVICEEEPGS